MSVGALIFLAIVGSFICAKVRVAGGAVVFALIALVLFVTTPLGAGLPARGRVVLLDGQPRHRPGARRLGRARCRMNEWRTRAACRSVDPDVFFPTAEAGPVYDAQVAVAKAVCAGCPVRAECLAEALVRIPYGDRRAD